MCKLFLAKVPVASQLTVFPFISPPFSLHSFPPLSPTPVGKLGMWTHTSLPSLTTPLAPHCNITPSKLSYSLPRTVLHFPLSVGLNSIFDSVGVNSVRFCPLQISKPDPDVFGVKLQIAKSLEYTCPFMICSNLMKNQHQPWVKKINK